MRRMKLQGTLAMQLDIWRKKFGIRKERLEIENWRQEHPNINISNKNQGTRNEMTWCQETGNKNDL